MRQIGNAVAVRLAEKIGETIRDYFAVEVQDQSLRVAV